jgi:hypothetical protein
MQRKPLFVALLLSLAAAPAAAQPIVSSARAHPPTHKTQRRHTSGARRERPTKALRAAAAAVLPAGDPVLFGDQAVESGLDSNASGWPEAFRFADSSTGTVSSIFVYVDSHNRATKLIAGLYSDQAGNPGTLITTGYVTSPHAGAWNQVPVTAAPIQSGRTYWIALLGRGGTLYFRDRNYGPCPSQNANQTSLSALTSTWSPGPSWPTCPVAAFVAGTLSTTPPPSAPPPPAVPPLLPPVNALAPTVSGNTVDGQTLTATPGTWLNSPSSYAYQWEDCDSAGANCTNISGAALSGYTLTDSDIGHTIRAVVTASNSAGSSSAPSGQTAVISPPPPPSSTTAPAISGSAIQGQTISTSTGSWTSNPTSYTYTWQDCDHSGSGCTNITGAAASSYVLGSSDVGHTIRAVVTAENAGGSGSASSSPTAVVTSPQAAPTNTAVPRISGTPTQGITLTTSTGSWNGNPTSYSYAWQDCDGSGASCTNITNASASSYVLGSSDVGHTIRAVVRATNAAGSASAISSPTAVVTSPAAAPTNTALPQISGTPTQGNALTTSNGSWNGNPTSYTYAWQDCSGSTCSNISGASSSSYTLQSSDVGDTVRVGVTAINSAGSGRATSQSVGPVSAQSGGGGQSTNCAPAASQTMTNTVSHLCGFADTTNAGVPAGTTLYQVPGQITGPTANTGSGWTWTGGEIQVAAGGIVKNVQCSSCDVAFVGNGGTLEDSEIEVAGSSNFPVQIRHASNITIDNNNIHGAGQGSSSVCDNGIRDIYGDSENLTVENNNIWWCGSGLNNIDNGGLIQGNYIHDLANPAGSYHVNGMQFEPGSGKLMTIENNTILNPDDQTDAIMLANDTSGDESNRVINHNLIAGGGYSFYGAGGSAENVDHVTFENNHFSRMFFSTGGYWGPDAYWSSANGDVWSGNVWDDSGASMS